MLSLSEYLEKVAANVNDGYGQQFRTFFADNSGSAELGMLASPTSGELGQLQKAVLIMTKSELSAPEKLTAEQIKKIAADAKIDPGKFAIFINGYALYLKK